jgi:RimJ/RimL family protein N-acetyltransferase
MGDKQFHIRPITPSDARQMAQWQYADEYAVYSFDPGQSAETVAYLLDPANRFYAVDNAAGELVAFCSLGSDGQVPGGKYNSEALDIGVGLRPELTGQGHGTALTEAIIAFALDTLQSHKLRVTVAAFNNRAQRVVEKHGFVPTQNFQNPEGRSFIIYVLDVSNPTRSSVA